MRSIQFLIFAGLFLVAAHISYAQNILSGTIVDAETYQPLPGASVVEKGTTNGVVTDFDGNFSIEVTSAGTLIISYVGYITKSISFKAQGGELGSISLESNSEELEAVVVVGKGVIDLEENRRTPVAVSNIRAADIRLKAAGNVEFTESFKNVPSVYVSNQAGGFGDSQVFLRGFDQINTAFLLNGQPINGMEDGRMYWSNWAGMADISNGVQVQRGLGSSKLAISSVGGTVNIVSKTTDRQEGGFVRFMAGNDSYLKGTASYSTGLNEDGWGFTFLIDHWQGYRKYAEGTAGQGQNYMFSVGYKPNENHSINFLIFGAPQWHDQNFSDDLETYEEFGEKYNANSGFLNGERYTERRNYYHKPVANLNWDWTIDDGMELSTVLYASWGRGGGTGMLGGASNVRDENGRIVFDQIAENNIANSNNGIGSFSNSRLRRSSVNNHNWYGLLSNLNVSKNENWSFNVGFDIRRYKGDHFRQINDFLGLSGYQDNFRTDRPADYVISQSFAADPWSSLFDFADKESRYDYDYSENINYIGGFGQIEYALDKFSVFAQGAISSQSYQREGRFTGRGSGLGESEKVDKTGYQIKGGAAFSFNDQNSIFANAGFYSRQPFLDNIFSDIRYSNNLATPEVDNEEITGFEGGYRFQNDRFRLNLDIYYTKWGNRFLSFGGPELSDGVNSTYRFTSIAQVHKGIEFDIQYRPLASSFMLRGYGSLGNWKYDGSTAYTLQNDETGDFIESGDLDLTGTYIGNAPQTSFGAGIRFNITESLIFDMDYNIYTDLYGFVDPEEVVDNALAGSVYQAEKLSAYALADAGLTYNFRFGKSNFVFRGNVYNLFNEPYIGQKDAFGYYLGIGRTYNVSLRYDF